MRLDPGILAAIEANARDVGRLERESARAEFEAGRAVYYCRGRGCSVVRLTSIDDWERRNALSRPFQRLG